MRLVLVKPPQIMERNFGTFNLLVLAEAVMDIASVEIIDATSFSVEEAAKVTLARSPDVIGATLMGLNDLTPLCALINTLRQFGFNGRIIVGGQAASLYPVNILQATADAVVYGDGELTLREILQKGISSNTQGIFFLKEGKLVKTSRRPLIDLDSVKRPQQPIKMNRMTMLETSRGCPHQCAFCGSSKFFGNTWRGMSAKKVFKDIVGLVKDGSIAIQITDDNFTANPARALQICDLLRNAQLPLFFIFSARSDDLISDPMLIPALARAHFLRANIGVETSDQEIAKAIHKNIGLEQHKQAFSSMEKEGIYTVASFIVGLPSETEAARRSALEFAVNYTDSATFIPFQPVPSTEMFQGKIEPEEWSVRAALELTLRFRSHDKSLRRLIKASSSLSVRGMFARASLQRRLNDCILDDSSKQLVEKAIGIDRSSG